MIMQQADNIFMYIAVDDFYKRNLIKDSSSLQSGKGVIFIIVLMGREASKFGYIFGVMGQT